MNQIELPLYHPKKKNLPRRSAYLSTTSWLKAIQATLGEATVFALDEALMCQENFLGRTEEYLVYVYGDDDVRNYNGVVLLGNHISPNDIEEKNGILFTNFNRTLMDAFANEDILDMQGITEALSKQYYTHGNFKHIVVFPKYQEKFEQLAFDAIHYYDND